MTQEIIAETEEKFNSEECKRKIIAEMEKKPNKERRRKEIVQLINDSGHFTEGHIANSFNELVQEKVIIRSKYGHYILAAKDIGDRVDDLTPAVIRAIQEAVDQITVAAKGFDIFEIEEADIETIRRIKKIRSDLVTLISELEGLCA